MVKVGKMSSVDWMQVIVFLQVASASASPDLPHPVGYKCNQI